MTRYAKGTDVTGERSRLEIERTVKRFGADEFITATTRDKAIVAFRASGRYVRFALPFPSIETFLQGKGPFGRMIQKTPRQAQQAYEQACREKWRSLSLAIKAKLALVTSGITDFDEEFFPYIVLPGGRTIYEETIGDVRLAYESGRTPPLLTHVGKKDSYGI